MKLCYQTGDLSQPQSKLGNASARTLLKTKQGVAIAHRIELHLCRLEDGLFSLVMFSGKDGQQPERSKIQGPYHHRDQAEGALNAISHALISQGYAFSDQALIWQLHRQSALRDCRQERAQHRPDYEFIPLGVMPELPQNTD